ncbi:methylmalonyl Co-A mutase-associated GTPase MeaB [Peribacillus sp. SCS-155]|uniref:methylmalonyl Co-A mutase-associated GTPase MeaB n=1 Tax=Peribacillus sedimenti TaxID=3115297 RepID=UPI003905A180
MAEGKRPEWADDNDTEHFASFVREGSVPEKGKAPNQKARFIRKEKGILDLDDLQKGLVSGDRAKLARAITLIESNADRHMIQAQELLQSVLPSTGNSIRIGISGVPGAGKSTFIETFGIFLCSLGYKVAVLAVDPSSTLNGGSILGDKTRMEKLARHPQAFIRPSPSGGTLGGVHRKTRETMLLCEAAGFDVILVETVGVGQSEAIVRGMVDFFMLLVLTGAGDEIQGMKKGIMELVDLIVVNKADGDNEMLAKKTSKEYTRFLHFLQPATRGWPPQATCCSSINGNGIREIWEITTEFSKMTKENGIYQERRRLQLKDWLYSLINEQLQKTFFNDGTVKNLLPILENQVMAGKKTVTKAVQESFAEFLSHR